MKGLFLILGSLLCLPSIAGATSTCWDGTLPEAPDVCPPYPPQTRQENPDTLLCSDFRETYLAQQRERRFYSRPELYIVPPEYEWVDGERPGTSMQYFSVPATYKTVVTKEVQKPRCVEIIEDNNGALKTFISPEIIREVTKRVVVSPEKFEQRPVSNLLENGKTRIVVRPSFLQERTVSF